MKKVCCMIFTLVIMIGLLTGCRDAGGSSVNNTPIADLSDLSAYYEQNTDNQSKQYFFYVNSLDNAIECPVTAQLNDILRIQEWSEVSIDPLSDEYEEQVYFKHGLGYKGDYYLYAYIGKTYGAVEWYSICTQDIGDGLTSSVEVYEGGSYFLLPQEHPKDIVNAIIAYAEQSFSGNWIR